MRDMATEHESFSARYVCGAYRTLPDGVWAYAQQAYLAGYGKAGINGSTEFCARIREQAAMDEDEATAEGGMAVEAAEGGSPHSPNHVPSYAGGWIDGYACALTDWRVTSLEDAAAEEATRVYAEYYGQASESRYIKEASNEDEE